MSFGFSVTDFVTCGQLAYKLYQEFRDAPGECAAFVRELSVFSTLVLHMGNLEAAGLGPTSRASLEQFALECKGLLIMKILGFSEIPRDALKIDDQIVDIEHLVPWEKRRGLSRRHAQFAQAIKLPKHRKYLNAQVAKMTAFAT